MKKRNVLSLVAVLGFGLLGMGHTTTHAAKPPKLPGVQSRGIRNMKYYIHSSANFGAISTAVSNWMYTGWDNPLYIYKQGNNAGTAIDFHAGKLSNGIYGWAEFYDGNDNGIATKGNAPKKNYYWSKITLNTTYKSAAVMTNGTVARHEIGHALGMGHAGEKDSSSIMQPSGTTSLNRKIDKPASDKLADIYGWK